MTRSFDIDPQGAFSLAEAANFGFGQRTRPAGVGTQDGGFDGVFRLAFCLDGSYEPVGVELRQDDDGTVHGVLHGDADIEAARAQVARVLSLDHDSTGYEAVAERDPVIAGLQAAAPGLRPPLFYSPYEAAFWSVLSARRPGWQMDRVRADLAREHGTVFSLAGVELAALPGPQQLHDLKSFPGIDEGRMARIHGVAAAALDGTLAVDRLRELDPDEAMTQVRTIKGIGPLYSSLIVIRALGHTDVLPLHEPKALELVRRLYALDDTPGAAEFTRIAEPWRPWRTWCTVLLRAAGSRVHDESS